MAEKEIILQGEDGQVDELVLTTQDQASCNSLEDCVRMLFPQEGETAPRLRFKGFDGKWEKRLLSDCLEISEEKNTDNVFGVEDVLSVSDDYGVVNQIEHLGRSYAGKTVSGYKILRPGQIVYTKSPLRAKPYGIVKVNRGKAGIVSVLYAVYNTKECVAPEYIHYYFDPAWRLNAYMRPLVNKGAKNTMNISDETALTGYIMIPKDIDEQRKIASFLQRLDEQVKHYQEQFDELKHLKSACLNEMFPKQNESIPSVRFSGFEGDWEIVSFKDITRLAGVRNRENLPLESYSISNENGFVPQNEQFENGGTMSKADKRLYYIVSPDSFAYNPARINVGSIGYDDLDKDVIVSSLYVVFKTDEKTYNPFLNYWFKTPTFRKLIEQYQEGGVRLYFFYDKLCKCSFRRPSFDEQRQIATFLSSLDKQISAQQEQLERLKQMKQSCLGLLFADNQSITPPLRFKGFSGEWKRVKLVEIANKFNYGINAAAKPYDGYNKYLRITDIDEDMRVFNKDNLTSPEANDVEAYLLQEGDIVLARTGASVGKSYFYDANDGRVVFAGFLIRVQLKDTVCPRFIFTCTQTENYYKYIRMVSQRSGQPGVNTREYGDYSFLIPPTIEEQRCIANFFERLDKRIVLQSQQVEKLKQVKKACLNQFIV